MAAAQKERSAKTAARRKTRGEEELRLHTMSGTRQALADLMAWHGIEEQGEAMTLMIHHLHGLGPAGVGSVSRAATTRIRDTRKCVGKTAARLQPRSPSHL